MSGEEAADERVLGERAHVVGGLARVATSDSAPLRLTELHAPSGRLCVTFVPGKHGEGMTGTLWERDVDADVVRLKELGCTTAVLFITPAEREELQLQEVESIMRTHHIDVVVLDIPHGSMPAQLDPIDAVVTDLALRLRANETVVVCSEHGLGRAPAIAACVLLKMSPKFTADRVIREIQDARSVWALKDEVMVRFINRYADMVHKQHQEHEMMRKLDITADSVARQSLSDTPIVRSLSWALKASRVMMVAIDASQDSLAAFMAARSLCRPGSDRIILAHVLGGEQMPITQRLDVCTDICRRDGIKVETAAVSGQLPGPALCGLARRHEVDIMFMSTRGMSRLRKFVMGSVSDYCVNNAPCSVMVVR